MFVYSPLNRHKSEIRLVRFIECPSDTSNLELELRHASMNDTTFNALSYVWGDCSETIDITLNGQNFPVGRSLHSALKQLRENGFRSWIWIDSICIQQTDLEEKGWHVQEMRTVYSRAECVYMWLGPGSDATDKTIEFMAEIGPTLVELNAMEILGSYQNGIVSTYFRSRVSGEDFGRSDEDPAVRLAQYMYGLLDHPGLQAAKEVDGIKVPRGVLIDGLAEIVKKENWHRIWIVQEVALARVGLIMCGTKTTSLEHFQSTFMTLWDCGVFDKRHGSRINGGIGFEWAWNWILPLLIRRRRQYWRTGPLRLSEILRLSFRANHTIYAASDPRDIIFGLLGVIEDGDELGLRADYTKSMAEVFTAATKAFLQQDAGINSYRLEYVTPRAENLDGLPSWVPDWREIGEKGTLVEDAGLYINATSGMPTSENMAHDESPWVLRRFGCYVSTITDVMETPKDLHSFRKGIPYGDLVEDFIASVLKFANLGPESGPAEDYVWRTFIGRQYGEPGSYHRYHHWMDGDVGLLVRSIMRQGQFDSEHLTESQKEFINNGPLYLNTVRLDLDTPQKQLEHIVQEWPEDILYYTVGRTLFKTNKAMFGRGHVLVQPGDIVTILSGCEVPIILRPREEGGYTFVGDAHVDGIMGGEFHQTAPNYQTFDIY
ncbi:uncharacterized protein NECHADRAFT_81314 [Fusarium vanettenii 77-13-4]|uniref:Heterokaryon incompatibility domain-containing protein n=1 Tax=Fusarium vanettenii (strain ATCC MYA-4622 / CBS 123669 / FGSC 9596 / NRRL 45880 / 77-13-4) TaxID=660122 RepID=C7ZKR3_FUSV7|nr:uncharacterized protein NECHADRAFT_81314 [Fusarium vanettenii 77-13-4]EEU35341.1 hypothetical protein NECHADRAFT_81314 [Fusarium vanettenii 77-13-4]